MTAVAMVAVIAAAAGRLNKPIARNPAPTTCVAAADNVQKGAGPGRKPKNFCTTFALKPSTFTTLSMPWWIMSAHLRANYPVNSLSICKARRSFTFPLAAPSRQRRRPGPKCSPDLRQACWLLLPNRCRVLSLSLGYVAQRRALQGRRRGNKRR